MAFIFACTFLDVRPVFMLLCDDVLHGRYNRQGYPFCYHPRQEHATRRQDATRNVATTQEQSLARPGLAKTT